MNMQPGFGYAASTLTSSMNVDTQYKLGHATWTWTTCSLEMDMRPENGHAARTWACSMDIDMQIDDKVWTWIGSMELYTQSRLGPAART
jgi:hypothetical protein